MPEASAGERAKASSEQADLDAEELRELERAEYYADKPAANALRSHRDRDHRSPARPLRATVVLGLSGRVGGTQHQGRDRARTRRPRRPAPGIRQPRRGHGHVRLRHRVSADLRRGQPIRIADYRLHIQEIWRIVRDGVIQLGYADYFYPPRDSTVARAGFVAREASRTAPRRPHRRLDGPRGARPRRPRGPRHGRRGSRDRLRGRLRARDFCASSATTDADGSDEFWRLIPPRVTGREPQFVVTAHGIER